MFKTTCQRKPTTNMKFSWMGLLLLVFLSLDFTLIETESRTYSGRFGFRRNGLTRMTKMRRSKGPLVAGWSSGVLTDAPKSIQQNSVVPESTGQVSNAAVATTVSKQWLELESVPLPKISAKLHGEVILECSAVGSPPPTIFWLKNGKPIEKVASFDSEEHLNGLDARLFPFPASEFSMAKLKSKLPLRCIRPEDEGEYSCVATQWDGPSTGGERQLVASTMVVIEEDDATQDWKPECEFRLPSFALTSKKAKRGTPAYIHAAESLHMESIGMDIVLPCRSGGKPKPKVIWTGTEGQPVIPGKKFQLNTKGDLIIRNLSWNEMGEYKCVVENPYGSESASTFLYPLLAEDS